MTEAASMDYDGDVLSVQGHILENSIFNLLSVRLFPSGMIPIWV
jgi:hypothetical protein